MLNMSEAIPSMTWWHRRVGATHHGPGHARVIKLVRLTPSLSPNNFHAYWSDLLTVKTEGSAGTSVCSVSLSSRPLIYTAGISLGARSRLTRAASGRMAWGLHGPP
ncbi:unnamed protein product [Boreogadus saida]